MATEKKQKIFTDEWNRILEQVAQFRRNSFSNWIWFRGHSDKSFELDSGLFRVSKKTNKRHSVKEYLHMEDNLSQSFKAQASTFVKEDYMELMFIMQHYGLKTRLLDWTDSFSTALYFAFNEWKYSEGGDASIWLLDPHALNLILHHDDGIFTADDIKNVHNAIDLSKFMKNNEIFNEKSFAVYPSKNSPRLLSQSGFFTLQGNLLKTLEEEVKEFCPKPDEVIKVCTTLGEEKEYCPKLDEVLKQIILPNNLVECIYEYLTINGVNHFSVYNDMESLCKTLNDDFSENVFNERIKEISKHF
ncbi:FRG domain-containing protein [Bacillus toyonensis]|nr:FRG domain-containing protein [Bacillus toyonensis]